MGALVAGVELLCTRLMMRKLRIDPYTRRARLSSREIVLALLLTVAAVAFVLTALSGNPQETAVMLERSGQGPTPN